ncbi:MAG: glycine oxidase ThiO [Mesorhizobium sp.]|uniref:glycine oxidase ThiO n=1 Tax=Mesorhizobium sp. TaxID=1871066 RepID=UPI000FE618FA|nr:glycine oxidase ThiO [Mesorhizobium sp.]RWJ39768.1 MAG: glycine oxidase ThiO [Mesorhizobium sp.]RWJ81379.1 MAG: glycine oxidase ThiO [Mesorhizobium sp.]TIR08890.1 MAG: glycine oxidase ThiO [Mesorhizobium sp.]
MRILVQGAGVAGLTAAHELAGRGAEVLVVEKNPSIGGEASWRAGGMLAPFCERESGEQAVIALGQGAAEWWQAALPGLVTFNGTLVVAPPRDTAELRRFAARTERYSNHSADAIAALEPDLAGRFRAGLFFAEEAHLDPRQALEELHAKLTATGVRFRFGCTEAPQNERFDRVVDCTGMAARQHLPDLRGVRGEMLYLETREVTLARPVRLIHPRFPVYVIPRGGGRFMVGATMIESADDGPVTARSLMELLNAAYALHPAFGEARVVECSAGVRPAFPDNLPRVVEKDDTIFINGFFRHGFLMAPAFARKAADIVFADHPAKDRPHETCRQRAIA